MLAENAGEVQAFVVFPIKVTTADDDSFSAPRGPNNAAIFTTLAVPKLKIKYSSV